MANFDPPIGDLTHGLTQADFSKKPQRYRFEIVCLNSTLITKIAAITGQAVGSDGVVKRVDLIINPQTYRVSEPTRKGLTQTVAGAWADWYGLGLFSVNLTGTTGYNPEKARKATAINPIPIIAATQQAVQDLQDTLAAIKGVSNSNTPTGLKDFVELRNRIHRTYARLLKDLNIDYSSPLQDQLQLRFYAWDTEDYFIVLIDNFELNRSSSRPMLYDYSIAMTVIGFPHLGPQEKKDFLAQYYNAGSRLAAIKNQVDKFVQTAEILSDAISGVILDIAQVVSSTAVVCNELSNDIQNVLTGAANVILMPLKAVEILSMSVRNLAQTFVNLEQIPVILKNDIHNQMLETLCSLNALTTYKSLFQVPFSGTFGQAPWANLTCSSTLGLPPSPLSPNLGVDLPLAPSPATASPLQQLSLPSQPLSVADVSSHQPTADFRIKEIVVAEGDSVESVIYKNGGLDTDVAQVWQQIVTLNDLEYPYVAPTASFQKEVFAAVMVTLYGTPGTSFPQGTRVATSPTTPGAQAIVFDTLAVAVVGAHGSVSVAAEAEQAGDFANVQAGAINQVLDDVGNPMIITGLAFVENAAKASGGKIWKVLLPGDKLKIPVTVNATKSDTYLDRQDDNDKNLFGVDLALDASGDLVTDATQDLVSVGGLDNMAAAVGDRLSLDTEELIKHPQYGLNEARMVGEPGDANHVALAKIELQATLLQDPRIKAVQSLTVIKTASQLNAKLNLLLTNEATTPVGISLPL